MAPMTRAARDSELDGEQAPTHSCFVVEHEPDADIPDGELAWWPQCQEQAETRAALAGADFAQLCGVTEFDDAGKAPCVLEDHEDPRPSLWVGETPEQGWYCYCWPEGRTHLRPRLAADRRAMGRRPARRLPRRAS